MKHREVAAMSKLQETKENIYTNYNR